MPFLKHVLENATTKELRLLRGKTIECISLIGLAVGSEKFMPDAAEIMEVLLKAQQQMGEQSAFHFSGFTELGTRTRTPSQRRPTACSDG